MDTRLSIKDKSENSRFLKAAAFRKNTRKTEPHKHNSYFEVIYLSAGKGCHFIDNKRYEVIPPVLFFVRREQVHHWDLEEGTDPDGFVLILKKPFFDDSLDGELKLLLGKVSKLSCVYFKDHTTVHQLLDLLSRENESGNEHSFSFNEGLVKGLFAKILQVAEPGTEMIRPGKELYHAFTELLSQGPSKKHTVAYYAQLLNSTPQNLNAVCRKAVDRPAADVLAEYLINEARRLLVYTDHTVSEISFALSFSDPSHFVKYFKRYCGHTPRVFRSVER